MLHDNAPPKNKRIFRRYSCTWLEMELNFLPLLILTHKKLDLPDMALVSNGKPELATY